jgi:hypothetical protein
MPISQGDSLPESITTPAKLSLSKVTPEESPELIAARAELANAEQQREQADAALNQRRATFNAKAATVKALRESVQAGDMEAAERAPVEYRELQAMEQEVSDFQRVAMARRGAVRAAEARLAVAEAVAGIGNIADNEEQGRIAAELGHAVKLILRPVLEQLQESDRNIYATIERTKAHAQEVPGLSMLGSPDRPSGFVYLDQRFDPHGETKLKGLFDQAWSNAKAELIEERKQAREQAQEG